MLIYWCIMYEIYEIVLYANPYRHKKPPSRHRLEIITDLWS